MHHQPVLLDEVLAQLDPQPGDIVLDVTLGLGGHSLAMLERIQPGGILVGTDWDAEMLELASARLHEEAPRGAVWHAVHAPAAQTPAILEKLGIGRPNVILMDCGLCSVHYDEAERGFSMKLDGPLDMRLSREAQGPTAADLVNTLSEDDLRRLFKIWGEEPNASAVARRIVAAREEAPLSRTLELAEIVRAAYPPQFRHGRRDPATRVFQALRLAVTNELEALAQALQSLLTVLAVGGRAGFIGFHSLENRLIKQACQAAGEVRFPTREAELYGRGVKSLEWGHVVQAGEEESDDNPRARSAMLRVATKTAELPREIAWPVAPTWQLPPASGSRGKGKGGRR